VHEKIQNANLTKMFRSFQQNAYNAKCGTNICLRARMRRFAVYSDMT